jgi:hypothetical protein
VHPMGGTNKRKEDTEQQAHGRFPNCETTDGKVQQAVNGRLVKSYFRTMLCTWSIALPSSTIILSKVSYNLYSLQYSRTTFLHIFFWKLSCSVRASVYHLFAGLLVLYPCSLLALLVCRICVTYTFNSIDYVLRR